jgi:tagaturonate reductase
VPGALPETQHRLMEEQLGYSDDLMIMSESYSLWAIERQDERIDELLSFASPNPGIVICKNIFKYLELKLRLLNGTHTMVCGLAMKCGFETVKEAMANSEFSHFVKALAEEEFAPCVTGDAINIEEAVSFSQSVLDRFRNPFLEHKWQSIAFQYSEKMRMRNIPLVNSWCSLFGTVPVHMSLGFAAFLLLLHQEYGKSLNNIDPAKADSGFSDKNREYFNAVFADNDGQSAFGKLLKDEVLWGKEFAGLETYHESVLKDIEKIRLLGANTAIAELNERKEMSVLMG